MMGKCLVCGITFEIKKSRTCGKHVGDRSRYKERYKDKYLIWNQKYYAKHKNDPHFQLLRKIQGYKVTPRLVINSWLL